MSSSVELTMPAETTVAGPRLVDLFLVFLIENNVNF